MCIEKEGMKGHLKHKGIGVVQRSKTLDHRCGGRPMKDGQKIKVA